ncbi:MAG: RNA degradosome polyphosphate kinase, partial [bacterium]
MNKNNNYTNYTQNRELSWLRFNHRVLLEASSKDVPILERLKFISIFMSNFDEFFMIRVGSLLDLLAMKSEIIDSRSGMNVKEQLKAIYVKSEELFNLKDEVYNNIQEELKACSIYDLEYDELDEKERKTVKNYFKNEVMPILSPQIVSPLHPFPHLNNKSL